MSTSRAADSASRRTWQPLIADPKHGPLPVLLLALTVLTGVVDAVSILRLGRVFVANMTGNVMFTGFALAGAPGFSLATSLLALVGFLLGAAAAGSLISRGGLDRARLLLAGVGGELVLVAVALAVSVASAARDAAVRDALAVLLALAMGIQNAVARRLAVPDLTTTVLTMTLTGIAADLRSRTGGAGLIRRLLSVATMLGGGVAGAALVLRVSTSCALAVATGLLAVVVVAAALSCRRPAQWRTI